MHRGHWCFRDRPDTIAWAEEVLAHADNPHTCMARSSSLGRRGQCPLAPVPYPMSLSRTDLGLVRMQAMIIMMNMVRPPACAVHEDYRVRHIRVTVVRDDSQV